MSKTHTVQLVDTDTGGTMHAEVYVIAKGPDRNRWRARCLDCDWHSDLYDEIGPPVEVAFYHGLTVHE